MRLWFPILAILSACGAVPAGAYDHFLHYSKDGTALPEKYNLSQVPAKTVTFFVSDDGPQSYADHDSFPSVLNQIRQAAAAWNGIDTSDLRVAFGGLYTVGTPDNSPGGAVVFEDLPPGVLAYSGPTTCEDTTPDGPAGCSSQAPFEGDTFLPILRSTMHMSRDLTRIPGPSFSETFFLVSVHEMGHALGLQHTFTSSTMSTITTRATSLSNPLEADDRAGMSVLYPTPAFASQFGSISGRVTYSDDRSPVHMASVIAVSATAASVSALTLPDGTFHIEGVKPGTYYLYAHPLPPTADIRSPQDSEGNAIKPSRPFNAVLHPGVRSLAGATQIPVKAGEDSGGLNFTVKPRSSVPIFDVSLYSYFYPNGDAANAVHPAYVNLNSNPGTVVASGVGLTSKGKITGGLKVQLVGGNASVYSMTPYSDDSGQTFLALYLTFSPFSSTGPQNLLFATPDYLYLLPAAFTLTNSAPPSISSVSPKDDGSVSVVGDGLTSSTQIYFDALPAAVQARDAESGAITVTPAAGASGQTATVLAYNIDGQNSSFLQGSNPATYTYAGMPAPSLTVAPIRIPAGAEAMVDITGTDTHFLQGRTAFGFGTHDTSVRRTFVMSPTHAIVDIGMVAGAAPATSQVTALTDFELVVAPQAFEVAPPQEGLPAAFPMLFNGIAGQVGSFAGAIVSVYGANLQDPGSRLPTVTLNDEKAKLLYTSANLINLQIPADLKPGTAILRVNNGTTDAFPVMITIDPPQAVIEAIRSDTTQTVDNTHPAQAGKTVDLIVSGFPNPGSAIDTSRVTVSVAGVTMPARSVTRVSETDRYDVQILLSADLPAADDAPVIVYIDGLSSVQSTMPVAPAARART